MSKCMTIGQAETWYRSQTRPNLTTIEKFSELLPQYIEASAELQFIKSLGNRMSALDRTIAQALADFAIAHPSICHELPAQADGAKRYEVIVNGLSYSLVLTVNGWMRENGDDKTQEFLASLPKNWVKAPLQLDVTAMKQFATGEQIAKAGLL